MATQQQLDGTDVNEHEGKEQCPGCGQWYKRLSTHWSGSSCQHPSFTDYQKEIIIGMMMGDGSRGKTHDSNNVFQSQMMTKPFLEWVSKELGSHALPVRDFCYTPERSAEKHRESGFRPNANADDYHHRYEFRTRSHPFLNDFLNRWYVNKSEIYFPEDIKLTPTILNVWYCCDGGLQYPKSKGHITINNRNQLHRVSYFEDLFGDIGFNVSVSSGQIRLSNAETPELLDYMGESPTDVESGFQYKWECRDIDEYQRLKEVHDSQPYVGDE